MGSILAAGGFSIATPRLLIRPFEPDDSAALYRLNSDRDVMRYTGQAPYADVAAALAHIQQYIDVYDRQGFGRWAVTSRDDGQFMGFCGLDRQSETSEVDLAFRFFPEHWASGYATEASRACLQAGFDSFGLDLITGRAMRENLASISVLQKLGMSYRQMDEHGGEFWLIYGVSADAFRRLTA